ncbi:putative sodium-dependent multivitamin transporter isoform X2 [Uloborus diversus]|uniref:putative sodium-dependent multivitamin transporter isoform X2 n=1 Tax=Uloborus diversus TaxID=327109 RepID=UPI00240959A3|nr:putative sodium-dependent multivitamin transporter isoform X2 [Uloborus diversus]
MLALDYFIFALMLLISAAIGIYFRFTGGKQKTNNEFLLADRNMPILPVAFSLMASFMSASSVIGLPADTYLFGLNMPYMNIGGIIGVILSSYLLLPVFFDMQLTTVYEILYMSVALYAPALALSAVTDLPIWASVVSTGVVCTFYCMMGGMKAVLWTDVFQALMMFLCVFAVLIKGLLDLGAKKIYQINLDGGRLNVPGFDFDPEIRYTMWNLQLQALFMSITLFGGNQVQVQRMLTLKSLTHARWSIIACIFIACPFHILNCSLGLVLYAYYYMCDPLSAQGSKIDSADQMIPYHIMSTLSQYPGLTGACVSGIFSATLSTLSSAVNSLTAVTMEDFIRPFFLSTGISEDKVTYSSKGITLFYGFLTLALTFLVATFGNLVQAAITIFGMVGGPALAVFLLGMLTKRSNEKGVIIGFILSFALALWASFGASTYGPPPETLSLSTEGCPLNSSSDSLTTPLSLPESLTTPSLTTIQNNISNSTVDEESEEYIFPLYRISYMWFAQIGFFSAIIIGYFASVLINLMTGEQCNVPNELMSPMYLRVFGASETSKKTKKMKGSLELYETRS